MVLCESERCRLEYETRSDRKRDNVTRNFLDSNDVEIVFRVLDNKFLDLLSRADKVRTTESEPVKREENHVQLNSKGEGFASGE